MLTARCLTTQSEPVPVILMMVKATAGWPWDGMDSRGGWRIMARADVQLSGLQCETRCGNKRLVLVSEATLCSRPW